MRFYILLLLLLFFVCCKDDSSYRNQLLQIESLIQSDPSIAITKLDSLYTCHPDAFLQSHLQAKYALLKTYCLYKQYINERNDSLISIAENYYLQQGSDYEKALSLFLHGQILRSSGDYYQAMKKYKMAAEIGQTTNDHYLIGQIYTHLYMLCADAYDANDVHYAQKALEEYIRYDEKLYILDGEINLGLAYFAQRQYDTCTIHLDKALLLAHELSDTFAIRKCIRQTAYINIEKGNILEAYRNFDILFNQYHAKPLAHDQAKLAYIHALLNHPDSATFYLENLKKRDFHKYNNKLYFYKYSALVNQQMHNYAQAYDDNVQYQNLKDSVYWQRLSRSVMKEDFDHVSGQLVKSQDKADNLIRVVWIVITLFGFTALWLYFYKRNKSEMSRHLQEELQFLHQKEEILKSELEAKKCQEQLLQEKLQLQEEKRQQAYQFLKQSEPVYRFQLSLIGKHSIVADDWRSLQNIFNEMLPSFLHTLDPENTLSEIELKICLLLKLGFKPSEIAVLTNHALGSISSVNNRLCKKKLNTDGGAKEWLEYIRSI